MTRSLSFGATLLTAVLLMLASPAAQARIALVVGEPYGTFGTIMPVGHASIYLDHVCSDTPTRLRLCQPGEAGVVLSRYHDLRSAGLDWMATPARIFFYGSNDPSDIPSYMTTAVELDLREHYRRQHLLAIAPDVPNRHGALVPPHDGRDWAESIGAAFDRRLFVYSIRSTPEQDQRIIDWLNGQLNLRRYSLGHANCADFAADLLQMVLGERLPVDHVRDFGVTTPKTLARALDIRGHRDPALDLQVYVVPQLDGSLRRSRPLRGPTEMLLTTKRYLATLIVLQPEAVLTDWIICASKARWKPGLDGTPIDPAIWPVAATNAGISVASAERMEHNRPAPETR